MYWQYYGGIWVIDWLHRTCTTQASIDAMNSYAVPTLSNDSNSYAGMVAVGAIWGDIQHYRKPYVSLAVGYINARIGSTGEPAVSTNEACSFICLNSDGYEKGASSSGAAFRVALGMPTFGHTRWELAFTRTGGDASGPDDSVTAYLDFVQLVFSVEIN